MRTADRRPATTATEAQSARWSRKRLVDLGVMTAGGSIPILIPDALDRDGANLFGLSFSSPSGRPVSGGSELALWKG